MNARWMWGLVLGFGLAMGCGDGSGGASPEDGSAPDGHANPDGSNPGDGGMPPCALPTPFDHGATYDAEIHVAEGGADDGDGTAASPLASLQEAAGRATAGTRIVLHAGTYPSQGFIDGLEGTPDHPIAIVGEGTVVLDADGDDEVLHLTEPRYVVLEGLTLRGASLNGLNIDDGGTFDTPAGPVVLRDLTVFDVGTGGNHDCIKLSGLDDFFILGGDFSECSAGGSMIDMVGCHDGLIAGNHFHDSPSASGIQTKGGSSDILIHGNRFVDVDGRVINAGGSTGLAFFRPADAPYEAARIRVVGNHFVRVGGGSGTVMAYVGCDACVFANNTVFEPRQWVARILQESTDERFVPSRLGSFVSNLLVLEVDDLSTFVNVGPDTAPETFTFGWNLWWALDRDDAWEGPVYGGGVPPETESLIQVDPHLSDLDGDDPRITAPSPAIGNGRPLDDPSYPDLFGRCYGDPPTIGAHEPR